MTKRDDANHSVPVRPSNADDWYGKTPPTATLVPPESASGAPGARVVPLVQLFDMKAHNAQFDARIAANPGAQDAQHRWPTWAEAKIAAKLGNPAAEKSDDSQRASTGGDGARSCKVSDLDRIISAD